jgi:hypothetical protein
MTATEIGTKVQELVNSSPTADAELIYNLLLAYGKPKASITRLREGDYNLSRVDGEICWKKQLFFKHVEGDDLYTVIDELKNDQKVMRHDPRFIIVTNGERLLALDTKNHDTLETIVAELNKHYVFFLPWAGMEKSEIKTENLADVKAAERMAKLYDEIIHYNIVDPAFYHSLNVFFSRLLFCFFAEDTEVFEVHQFTNSIASHTQHDGSDLHVYLDDLFRALDVEEKSTYAAHLAKFPYVNGGLFSRHVPAPKFSRKARDLLLQCGELDWSQINPDIFGSMIQAVVHPGQRAVLGMHYTSVVNIMKVIEPLFLEELQEEFDKAGDDKNKLNKLLGRIYTIKVFDPACGSGNFLIISYKELRKLEHKILEKLLSNKMLGIKVSSGLRLENFYGIEIDDFAREIAVLSLWLAKHLMNIEFKKKFGKVIPLIPLKDTGNVVCANAATSDWQVICPNTKGEEVYVIGNPPYLGSTMQDDQQKSELAMNCYGFHNYKNLDYIAIWFIRAAKYIAGSRAQCALVSTNSICQGEQVSLLWPSLLRLNLEISFAYQSFKWSNSAKHNAGVICVIVGLRNPSNKPKYIFNDFGRAIATNINPYLSVGPNVIVTPRSKPLSGLPLMSYGNKPVDGGNLILSADEKRVLVESSPQAAKFLRRLYGSQEFLNDIERWCIWVTDAEKAEALSIPQIQMRADKTKLMRLASKDSGAQGMAGRPHQFREMKEAKSQVLIVPRVSSERRRYIPIGYLSKESIILDSAQAIYDADTYVFGLVSSRMHMAWTRAVAGRLKSDFRYSSAIVYNTFPVPKLSPKQKDILTTHSFEVLDVRERHSEHTLAELYDPDKMPDDLQDAHNQLDDMVDLCYRSRAFETDDERLTMLFKLYETMTHEAQEKIYA